MKKGRENNDTPWRLWMAFIANLSLSSFYFPALAKGRVFHTFSSSSHPWQNLTLDVFVFTFVAVALVTTIPVILNREAGMNRFVALIFLLLPIYTIAKFINWSVRLLGN